MGSYINSRYKDSYVAAQIIAIYGHAMGMHTAAAQRKNGAWWGDKWRAPIKESAFYNSSRTRIELQAADARGLGRCWAAGS